MTRHDFNNWRKALRSGSKGGCVSIGEAPGLRGIRDTTLGEQSPTIVLSSSTFATLINELRQGRLHA